MKQLLTEWRKFIKEQEEQAESSKTTVDDLIDSLVADPDKTPKASAMSPKDLKYMIAQMTAAIERDNIKTAIKKTLSNYYENPAILDKMDEKFGSQYSAEVIKNYLKGQINKIEVYSIFGTASIEELNRDDRDQYKLAIRKFRDSPTMPVFIPTRKALAEKESLLVLVNPIALIETDIEQVRPMIIQAIQRDINKTIAITPNPRLKQQFKPLPDAKVLMLLKNAMLKQNMFDDKGRLNKKGKEFIKKIKGRFEITDLIQFGFKSGEVLQQVIDALNDDTFLSDLEDNLVQITKADQGEEEVATA